MYQISSTSFEGHQWVVGFGRYCIIGNSLSHNFQDIILTPRTIGFIIKIVNEEHEVLDTLPQYSDIFASSIFIELFHFSLGDNLTPLASFLVEITNGDFLIYCPTFTTTLQLGCQYLVYCFLPPCYGIAWTYPQ
jgi:hypothetical protein